MTKPIFCLLGPTASGKTALALQLAASFPFEIVSVDSALIYREMDIGTAKPSKEELSQAPHHLIDILDPNETYSCAAFCADAHRLIAEIRSRNHYPLFVGGTMMYFHALQQGLSTLPEANADLRAQFSQKTLAQLYEALSTLDPVAAATIKPQDKQRIYRALEVIMTTGKTLSSLRAEEKKAPPYSFITTHLIPADRSLLHQAIANRFHQMLAEGFVEEVQKLCRKWALTADYPSMRTVGYRQALDYLSGALSYTDFVEKGIIASRQLAKRQLTWLRHWQQEVACSGDAQAIFAYISKEITVREQNI